MPVRTDIHRYAVRLEVALRGLEKASIPVEDKLSIREFSEVLRSEGLNLGRVAKYVYHMKTVAQKLSESGTTLNGADPSSLKGFMRWVNESGVYRPYTKRDFIVVMKRFYQWLRAPPNEYSSWRKNELAEVQETHPKGSNDKACRSETSATPADKERTSKYQDGTTQEIRVGPWVES